MKKNKWALIGLGILLLLVFAAIFSKNKNKPKGINVDVEKPKLRTIHETVSASGKIFPEKEVKISSDVSGEVTALYVQEGEAVVFGQLLAKIDPEAYDSAVEQGEAGLNQSKSALANSESQIDNSKAALERLESALANAKIIHDRNISLLKEGVISQADFDQSLLTLDQTKSDIKSSQASLVSAIKNAEGARFQVESAKANLKQLKTDLRRTRIIAPTNGTISSLSIEQGERVVGTSQMTGTEMMRIANLTSMEVQVEVSENDILRVELGDNVDIEVDAYLDKKFIGVVTEIANSASNIQEGMQLNTDQVTTFIVKIRIDTHNPANLKKDGSLYPFRPGMSAAVEIYTETKNNVLAIPIQGVTVRQKEHRKEQSSSESEDIHTVVFTMTNDTASMNIVEVGIQDDEFIEVISGLSLEDNIITGPYTAVSKKLKSGKNISIKEKKKEP